LQESVKQARAVTPKVPYGRRKEERSSQANVIELVDANDDGGEVNRVWRRE
jgi:hypothetical protein